MTKKRGFGVGSMFYGIGYGLQPGRYRLGHD